MLGMTLAVEGRPAPSLPDAVLPDVPYVECDPKGARARPDLCARAGVRSYPTWVIGEARHEGVLTIADLARISRFTGEAAAGSR